MNKRGSTADIIIVVVAVILLFSMCFSSVFTTVEKETNLRSESFRVGRQITESTPGTCKEQNLRFYWWFRSKGYSPLIQVGKKDGQEHMWLELDRRVYDATDWKYNDQATVDVYKTYVKAEFEEFVVQ